MYRCFEGSTALVTGGGSGIGEGIVKELAREGANLVVVDVNVEGAERVKREIGELGAKAITVCADLTRPEECKRMVDEAQDAFGGLQFAVNCAGINGNFYITGNRPDAEWRNVMAIDMDAVFHSMQAEIAAMLAAGGGAIVNISSVFATIGFPLNAPYATAKAGVLGLSRSAAIEYAARNIRINVVSPGPVWTPLSSQFKTAMEHACSLLPIGRGSTPDEIAPAVVFALSDKASFMIGSEIVIDGGYTIS